MTTLAHPSAVRRRLGVLTLLLPLWSLPAAAGALDYQFHAFASQAAIYSDGNNLFGHSTTGSVAYNEFGANATVVLMPQLLVSAQALLRDAGNTESDSPRLDYALLDYQAFHHDNWDAGIRLGRVKNPYGLFNETRDVVFTRPGILMPQSVYFENAGLRSLLFSSDGGQLYGDLDVGGHYLSIAANAGLNFKLNEREQMELVGSAPVSIHINHFYVGRLMDDIDGSRWKFAFSYLHAGASMEPDPGASPALASDFKFDLYVASARYNAERFSLTAEYELTSSRGTTAAGDMSDKGDGLYLQADYRLLPKWSLMARYDLSFSNRNDRNGTQYAAQTGGDRHSQFARDAVLGVQWQPDEHWGVWTEYHMIDGTATVSALDNRGRTLQDHWSVALLMVGYRY